MKTSFIAVALLGVMSVTDTQGFDLSGRVSSWMRDVGSAVDEKAVQPIKRLVDDSSSRRVSRDSAKDHVSSFVKGVESLLDRLVPNKNFVQDLMGIPEPETSHETSREINNILGKAQSIQNSPRFSLSKNIHMAKHEPYAPQIRDISSSNAYAPRVPYGAQSKFSSQLESNPSQMQLKTPRTSLLTQQLGSPLHMTYEVSPRKAYGKQPYPGNYYSPPEAERPHPSVFSRVPGMMHNFAQDWFQRED